MAAKRAEGEGGVSVWSPSLYLVPLQAAIRLPIPRSGLGPCE